VNRGQQVLFLGKDPGTGYPPLILHIDSCPTYTCGMR
jgi:hypothetical protein